MRRRGLLFLSIAACLLIVAAQGAFARDYFDRWEGHWQRSVPGTPGTQGTTYQAWEFTQQPGPTPSVSNNPYGTGQLTVNQGHWPDPVTGPNGGTQPINTWHIDQDGGTVVINLPNNPVPNLYKLIYLQVTSDKMTLGNQNPSVVAGGSVVTSITSPGPVIMYDPTGWGTYNWLIKIEPNPNFETITLVFPQSTNIEEIVVDTICTVPEPSTLAVFATSGLFTGVFALRRRRK